jgi:hypothetical protein
MNRNAFSTESSFQPQWQMPLALVIVLGCVCIAVVLWLYLSERGNCPRWLRISMAAIRFSLLALVLWMLGGWNWLRTRTEPPELVIAVDVSDSMLTADAQPNSNLATQGNSPQTRLQQTQELLSLTAAQWNQLQRRYLLRLYAVADDLQPMQIEQNQPIEPANLLSPGQLRGLSTSSSRLGDSLNRIIERQLGRGTAAIVFFSDGITTAGATLVDSGQQARRAAIPVHAIAIGRQYVQPDLRLADILAEPQVYLGDRVTIQANLIASDIASASVKVRLIDTANQQVLDQQIVDLTSENSQPAISLGFIPATPGAKKLKVAVDELPNEGNTSNNQAELSLLVQNRTLKVLMVFETPSYEFRFLKHYIERTNESNSSVTASYELRSVLQDGDLDYVMQDSSAQRFVPSEPAVLSEIDAFVFGHFDASIIPVSSAQAIVKAVTHGGAGCIFISGDRQMMQNLAGSPLSALLPIEATKPDGQYNQWQFISTKLGESALPLQWTDNDSRSSVQLRLPKLESVMRVDRIKPGAQVLAEAVDKQGTRTPLLISQFAGAGRTVLLATDETYRWTGGVATDSIHQQFWGQTLRWLSRGKLSSLEAAELTVDPKQSQLGTPVRFRLRLPTGVLLPESATTVLSTVEGVQRSEELTRVAGSANTYQTNVTQLEPGHYRAVVTQPPLAEPPAVEFTVIAPPGELAKLRADIEALTQLAQLSRGRLLDADNAHQWIEQLPEGHPTRLGSLPPQPIWNSSWVAGLFVLLITGEWLLRRHARML